jgi:hypothetical protein
MKNSVDVKTVREVALEFWRSLNFSVGMPGGIQFTRGIFTAAEDIATAQTVLPNSRLGPGGHPLDIVFPSIWHAICSLLSLYIRVIASRSPFSSEDENYDQFFGQRWIFRGQSRPWNIIPSAWRNPSDRTTFQKRLDIFHRYLMEFMTEEDDIELDLLGRPKSLNDAAVLAQHYGLPTSLVDFTFDPRVAFFFASSHCGSDAPRGLSNDIADYGVIDCISFYKMCVLSSSSVVFPPIQAQRLYRQAGLLIDFEVVPPTIPEMKNLEEPWKCLQDNCLRFFFPRTYPESIVLNDLRTPDFMRPEPFFSEIVQQVRALKDEDLGTDSKELIRALRSGLKNRPPWRTKELDQIFIVTDEELAAIGSYVEYYVRVASLIEMDRVPRLDPFVIWQLMALDRQGLNALMNIPRMAGHSTVRLKWIGEKIKESEKNIKEYLDRHKGR